MNQHFSIFSQTDCHRVGRGVAFRMGEQLKVMAVISSLHGQYLEYLFQFLSINQIGTLAVLV